MTRTKILSTLLGILVVAAVGCGRDSSEAGAKLVGVGFDPGSVQPAPLPTGGVVDFTNLNVEATNLDMSITGLYYPGDPFIHGGHPFSMVAGGSYIFHPALNAADEMQLLSPKGPDAIDTCFVTKDRNGPLGSFTTVDVGDNLRVVSNAMRMEVPRDPGDYPGNTTDVFITYFDTNTQVMGHPDVDANWAYDADVWLEWDGGLPPAGAPVASIPQPSWAGDLSTGKPSGSPMLHSPPKLTNIQISDTEAALSGDPMEFAPSNNWLDSPLDGNGDVLKVSWDAWEEAEDYDGFIVIQVRLLYEDAEGTPLACPWDPAEQCDCVDFNPDDEENFDGDLLAQTDMYCDSEYQPDPDAGNTEDDEGGSCDDGIDNDMDYGCDTDGCVCVWNPDNPTCPEWMDGRWMGPDQECARHYQIAECRSVGGEKRCFTVGGDRNVFEGALAGELTCSVSDAPGSYTISQELIEELLDLTDRERVDGAMLLVGRVVEKRVTMPKVRDEVGNQVDIGQIRWRMSNVSVGRLAVDRKAVGGE